MYGSLNEERGLHFSILDYATSNYITEKIFTFKADHVNFQEDLTDEE